MPGKSPNILFGREFTALPSAISLVSRQSALAETRLHPVSGPAVLHEPLVGRRGPVPSEPLDAVAEGVVDVCGRSPTRMKRLEEGRVPGMGRSTARPFCTSISGFPRMLHRFCNTPDAINTIVQVRAAAGSHPLPNPWPWPTRWAGAGTSCHRGREGYRPTDRRLAQLFQLVA